MFDVSAFRSSTMTVMVDGKPVEVLDTGYSLRFSRKAANFQRLSWERETRPSRVLVCAHKVLTPDEFDAFAADLLAPREWLAGGGGHCLDGSLCVQIVCPGRPNVFVRTEGYDYARYVAVLPDMDALLPEIASEYLSIPTLQERGRDMFDFHDVGVGALRDALRAAFRAGVNAA